MKFDLVNDSQSLPDKKTEEFNNFISFKSFRYSCDKIKSKGSYEIEVSNVINELPDHLDDTSNITLNPFSFSVSINGRK